MTLLVLLFVCVRVCLSVRLSVVLDLGVSPRGVTVYVIFFRNPRRNAPMRVVGQ